MALNGNKINLLKSGTVKLRDKFKIRHIAKENPCSLFLCQSKV